MILTPITLTDKSEDILGPTISNLQVYLNIIFISIHLSEF